MTENNQAQPEQNLSQEEISELAEAMNGVKPDNSEGVRSYDFVHPEKLSKRNLRALELLFAETARAWDGVLTSFLKTPVNVMSKATEQARYGNYVESVQDARPALEFSLEPLPGSIFVEIPAALGLSLVDRLAGGGGEVKGDPRPLTQIERNIVKRVVNDLLAELARALRPVAAVEFAFVRYHESSVELAMDGQESLVTAETVWTIGDKQSGVNVLLPVRCLYPVLDILTAQHWFTKEAEGTEIPKPVGVANLLDPVQLTMTVELGRARISLADAVNMEVGDVIRLNTGVDDVLRASVAGRPMFTVRPGLSRNKVAVQIASRASGIALIDDTERKSYAGAA